MRKLATALAAAVVIATSLAATSLASAAVTFSDPLTLIEGQSPSSPHVVVDAADRSTVVWSRSDGSNKRIQSVRLGADGIPGPVRTLSAAGQDARDPEAVVDDFGNVTVVWSRSDGTNLRVQAVRLDAARGSPGPVETLSGPGQGASGQSVAVDDAGNVTVVWSRSDGTNERVQAVRLRQRGRGGPSGSQGPIRTLSAAGRDAGSQQLAVDDSGRVTVVWSRSDGTNTRIQSVRLGADGIPGPVKTLSEAGQNAQRPQVAVDGIGRATVVWSHFDGSIFRSLALRIEADGNPGMVKTIAPEDEYASRPQVAIDSSDRAIVIWTDDVVFGWAARIAADGTIGPGERWGVDPKAIRLVVDHTDHPWIAWGGDIGQLPVVRLAADGPPAVEFRDDPQGPGRFGEGTSISIAIDGSNRPVVVFSQQAFAGPELDRIQWARGELVDAGAELIVNGPTRSAASVKGFAIRVSNLGTVPMTIDPATDTSAEVTVNGLPAGSVELRSTKMKTLEPGERTRIRYRWNLEGSTAPGDTVVYSGAVAVADDGDSGNDTDSVAATAR